MKTTSSKITLVIIVVGIITGVAGYALGANFISAGGSATLRVAAPPAQNNVRVLYSLDKKQNDRELISLIDNAKKYVYFAIYEFTLNDVADALARAKKRGVDVRGIMDRENSTTPYEAGVIKKLKSAGIPIETQKHIRGIMHIKALVTEKAYASGSYNWTYSATNVNDEVLEIGTDPYLRKSYLAIIKKILTANAGGKLSRSDTTKSTRSVSGVISYKDASKYIGQTASVSGIVVETYTSSSGTTFFDYCVSYGACPFSAVIFSSDKSKFGSLTRYQGRRVIVTGTISSYKGRAEIILNDPSQVKIK